MRTYSGADLATKERFCLRLLGGFEVARADEISRPIPLSTRKACAILAFLAMQPNRAVTRDELASLLWGSVNDHQARQSLRQSLVLLRKNLGSSDILSTDKTSVRLQPGIWSVDALDLDAAAESADLADLERACALLRGEFLAGLAINEEMFEDWLREERSRIHAKSGRVLAAFAEQSERAGHGRKALAASLRLIALDPLREDWLRLALRISARCGERNQALALARDFERMLHRELGVEPEPETQELIKDIRIGDLARAAPFTVQDRPGVRALVAAPNAAPQATADGIPVDHGPASAKRAPLWKHHGRLAAACTVGALLVTSVYISKTHGLISVGESSLPYRESLRQEPSSQNLSSEDWRPPRLVSRWGESAAAIPGGITPIAILPLTASGQDSGVQTIADTMTDDLINVLSRVSPLRVISRQSVEMYRGRTVNVAAIGLELGVRYVLEGSVRIINDKLHVNVELVDSANRLVKWSTDIERDGGDRQAIQSEIVRSLGRELQIVVNVTRPDLPSSEVPGLDEMIHKGWAAFYSAVTSGRDGYIQAERYFERALDLDARNGVAQIGLAAAYVNLGFLGYNPDAVPSLTKAEAILQQFIDDRPNGHASAFFFLGMIHRFRDDLDGAIGYFSRSLELNPSFAPAYAHLGYTLSLLGRDEEGLELINYAIRLSPHDPSLSYWFNFAGRAEFELRHDDRAIEYFRRGYALYPRYPSILAALAAAYALSGDLTEAHAYVSKLRQAFPDFSTDQITERFGGLKRRSGQSRITEGFRKALAN